MSDWIGLGVIVLDDQRETGDGDGPGAAGGRTAPETNGGGENEEGRDA